MKDKIKYLLEKADMNRVILWYYNKLNEIWMGSNWLNRIRRKAAPFIYRVYTDLGIFSKRNIRLHLACGNRHLHGFLNIDFRKTHATDLVCDIRKLPFPSGKAILIESYHSIEHIPRNQVLKTLSEWYRILSSGGKIIIECPDFDAIVQNYLKGDESQLDGIFGHQRFEGDYHLFGYNQKRLAGLLHLAGFTSVIAKPPQDYHAKKWPCLRMEARKF